MAIHPLKQFEIKQIGSVNLAGFDVAVTNQAVWTMATTGVLCVLLILASRGRQMVPNVMQNVLEVTFGFVEDMITSTSGREGLRFFPFVFTLFTFMLVANLSGMIPGSYTSTSQITITASFALLVFLMVWVVGFSVHGLKFFKLFAPSGVPKPLLVLLIPLELISFFARPLTLSVRLMANMLAGHILLKVFAGFAVMLIGSLGVMGIFGAILPGVILVALSALEVFVALIQAYIFALLTCVYLNDALHLH
mgnify:CR=1 FL=1